MDLSLHLPVSLRATGNNSTAVCVEGALNTPWGAEYEKGLVGGGWGSPCFPFETLSQLLLVQPLLRALPLS